MCNTNIGAPGWCASLIKKTGTSITETKNDYILSSNQLTKIQYSAHNVIPSIQENLSNPTVIHITIMFPPISFQRPERISDYRSWEPTWPASTEKKTKHKKPRFSPPRVVQTASPKVSKGAFTHYSPVWIFFYYYWELDSPELNDDETKGSTTQWSRSRICRHL